MVPPKPSQTVKSKKPRYGSRKIVFKITRWLWRRCCTMNGGNLVFCPMAHTTQELKKCVYIQLTPKRVFFLRHRQSMHPLFDMCFWLCGSQVEGVTYDIANLAFRDLPPKFQLENMKASDNACCFVLMSTYERRVWTREQLEEGAMYQHDAWMQRNHSWAPPEQMLLYVHHACSSLLLLVIMNKPK